MKRLVGTRQAGMGLVEIMVAMSMSLVVIGAVIQMFLGSKESYRVQEALSRIQENGRYGLRALASDIRQTGFLGQLYSYWQLTEATGANALPSSITGECFTKSTQPFRWIVPISTAVDDDASSTTPTVTAPSVGGSNDSIGMYSGCINSTNWQTNTDVLSLTFVDSKTVSAADLLANATYVKTDINHGVVFRCASAGTSCDPAGTWDATTTSRALLISEVFWIRKCTEPGADGVCGTSDDLDQPNLPALVRTRLDQSGSITTDAIAEGVANMQVQYGADPNNDGYATLIQDADEVGALSSAANWSKWHRVRYVRVWLLIRSTVKEGQYSGPTSFDMGDHAGGGAINATSGYRHQVFTTTVAIRNYEG